MIKREKKTSDIHSLLFICRRAHTQLYGNTEKNRSKSHGSTARKYVFDLRKVTSKFWRYGATRTPQIQSDREREQREFPQFVCIVECLCRYYLCTFPFGDFVLPRRRFSSHSYTPRIRAAEKWSDRHKNELKIRPKLLILGFRCERYDSWSIVTLFCMFNFAAVARALTIFSLHRFGSASFQLRAQRLFSFIIIIIIFLLFLSRNNTSNNNIIGIIIKKNKNVWEVVHFCLCCCCFRQVLR